MCKRNSERFRAALSKMCVEKVIIGRVVKCCETITCVGKVCIEGILEGCQEPVDEQQLAKDMSWVKMILLLGILILYFVFRRMW